MKQVLFITGNEHKVWQAKKVLKPYGIEVEVRDLSVVEIQAHDPHEIAYAKAEAAYALAKRPLIACDHSWAITTLNGFPGGYMSDVTAWFKPEDFLALMQHKKDRSVTLTESIVYTNGKTKKLFSVEYKGHVIHEARGNEGISFEKVTVFDGQDITISEARDAKIHARDMEQSAWKQFGQWYSQQK